jgi:hypothetical protein
MAITTLGSPKEGSLGKGEVADVSPPVIFSASLEQPQTESVKMVRNNAIPFIQKLLNLVAAVFWSDWGGMNTGGFM